MGKKILVFGGSFDPPHVTHAWLLLQAMEVIQPDEVLVAPAWSAALKNGHVASYDDRREMVRLTLEDFLVARRHKLVSVWDFEARRGRRTYSYELVEDLSTGHNFQNDVYFLAGSDCLEHLHEWRNIERFANNCTLVVGIRKGTMVGFPADYSGEMLFLPHAIGDESSTHIRNMIAQGVPINNLVSPATLGHIMRKKLYTVKEKV